LLAYLSIYLCIYLSVTGHWLLYSAYCLPIILAFLVAKVFLDPLDNEDFTKNSIDMDLGVLIRESNAGSTRWKNCGANLPFDVPPLPTPPIQSSSTVNGSLAL
jgi:hypothetical protein